MTVGIGQFLKYLISKMDKCFNWSSYNHSLINVQEEPFFIKKKNPKNPEIIPIVSL